MLTKQPTSFLLTPQYRVDALCDTLRVDGAEQRPLDDDEVSDDVSTRELIAAALGEAEFPPASSDTTFTLPLAFD